MGRPLKQRFFSLKVSTKALEEKLKRDPDQLDSSAFAEQLDHLLHKAINMGVQKKEIVDLLIGAHKDVGIDLNRAFAEDAVGTAMSAIIEAMQGAANVNDAVPVAAAADDASPSRGELEALTRTASKAYGGQQVDTRMTAMKHINPPMSVQPETSDALANDEEVLEHGAIGRHADGRLVFTSEEDAAEYELRTGRSYHIQAETPD